MGVGDEVRVRPGFARVALLLEVTVVGIGPGVRVWVQHSSDGVRWADLAAFDLVAETGAQVAWVEAQPALAGGVVPLLDGEMSEGEVHQGFMMSRVRVRWTGGGAGLLFGVEAVAIYERR
jgi:hypothetical protein